MNLVPIRTATWSRRGEFFIPALLVLAVFLLKLPILHVPYYWDEAGAYFYPSFWLSSRDLLDVMPGRHPAEMFFGHPPLLYLLMALLFKLFGPAPAVAHLTGIFFAALALFYTYRLGVMLFGRDIAIGSSLLLISTPLFFAQSGMLLGDIPAAACGVAAVYYCISRRYGPYLFFATSAVMIKEHAALLILVLALYELFTSRGKGGLLRHHLLICIPLVILGLFFLVQKSATGSFLPNPYFASNPFFAHSGGKFVFKVAFATYWAFFAQGRFLLALVTGYALWRFRRNLPSSFSLFSLIIGSYVASYSVIYFVPRYMLMILPFICLVGSACVSMVVQERLRYAAAMAFLCLVSVLFPDLRRSGYDNFETSMQYLDVVSVHRKGAAHLEKAAAGELIYAPWPLSSMWADAAFGYLDKPLNMTTDPAGAWKYVVYAPQADRTQSEAIAALVRQGGMEKAAHFEQGGKVLDLYARRDSGSREEGK